MASANVIITYEGDASSLKTTIDKINQVNDEIVKSATETSKKVGDEYKKAASVASAAFASTQVKNAFDNLNKEAADLIVQLKKLEDEQISLIASGNRVSKAYKENAAAQMQVKNSIEEVNRELQRFKTTTDSTEKSQKSLTGQLRQMKQELALLESQGKDNTKEFQNLLIAAGRLEDQIGDTRARVRQLASDTFKFDVAVQSVSALTAGFEVAQGAAALFGDESQDLQKALLKVQAATAIANGVQQLSAVILEENELKTAALTAANRVYTYVTTGATAATKLWRAALVATGIGALVVAIGFLVEKIMASGEASEDAADKANEYAKALQKVNDVVIKSAAEQELALNNLAKARGQISDEAAASNERTIKTNEALKTSLDQTLSDIEERRKLYYDTLEEARKNDDLSERDLIGTQIKLRNAFEADKQRLIQAGADRASAIRTQAITDEIEANKKLAQETADNSLKAAEQRIRRELAIDGESQAERIALANNLAKQEKQNAINSIKNEELKAATIGRINAELANEIAAIKLDEQKKAIEFQVLQLENVTAIGNATLQQEIDLANKRAELAKKEAESETDPTKRAELVKKAETDAANTIRELTNKRLLDEKTLNEAIAQLRKTTGEVSLSNDEDLINAQFATREQALKNEAAQTIEGQKKLAVDLQNLEAEKQQALANIRLEYANKELEIENIKINTLITLGKDTAADRIKLAENELEQKKKLINAELISDKEKQAKIAQAEAETQVKIRAERKKTLDDIVEIAQETANIFSGFAQAAQDQSNIIIEQITRQSEAELEAINSTNEREADKQRKREALEKRTNAAIAAEKTKQAKLDRAIAAFNVVVNTASYIIRLGEQLGVAAIPFQIAAGVLGATQLAVITSQPLPKFKKGGMIGGKSHEQGGTIIEAEKGEFIMNKNSTSQHRKALDAMNTSSAAFKKYIEDRYVRPAILDYAMKGKDKAVVVNASLNSKSMEKKLDKLNKSMKNNSIIVNIGGDNSRYAWHNR